MAVKIPGLKQIVSNLRRIRQSKLFSSSGLYWEKRYAGGGNSGQGSYGQLSIYKATVLNNFVKEHDISSVIEFGCGDGNQLSLSDYPSYIGLDVSVSGIQKCISRFKNDKTKSFYLYNSLVFEDSHQLFSADLGLSLDVTYHLIETNVYEAYLAHLFNASRKYVIIYAWDVDGTLRNHVLHRKFSTWIQLYRKDWELVKINTEIEKAPGACNFYFYRKNIS